jgi:hypothetical protein
MEPAAGPPLAARKPPCKYLRAIKVIRLDVCRPESPEIGLNARAKCAYEDARPRRYSLRKEFDSSKRNGRVHANFNAITLTLACPILSKRICSAFHLRHSFLHEYATFIIKSTRSKSIERKEKSSNRRCILSMTCHRDASIRPITPQQKSRTHFVRYLSTGCCLQTFTEIAIAMDRMAENTADSHHSDECDAPVTLMRILRAN